jgi:DNA-binding NarL/FixJ family response regulator
MRIVLVEDEVFTRSTMKAALQLQGIEVVHDTGSVGSAMKIAEITKPDAALLDLDLGGGPNGIDLAFGLRRILPKIGIVLLTGFSDPRLLDIKVLNLPTGSRYLVKHRVHDVEILVSELAKSIHLSSGSKPNNEKVLNPEFKKISDAQIETLKYLAQGLSNGEIARLRCVSEKSVEQAISRLVSYFKIEGGTHNKRVGLSRIYFQQSGSLPNG